MGFELAPVSSEPFISNSEINFKRHAGTCNKKKEADNKIKNEENIKMKVKKGTF